MAERVRSERQTDNIKVTEWQWSLVTRSDNVTMYTYKQWSVVAQHGSSTTQQKQVPEHRYNSMRGVTEQNVSNDSVTHTVDGNWLARGHMYVIVNRDMSLSTETCHRQQRHVTVGRVTVVSWHGQPTEFAVHTVRLLQHQGNRMWSGIPQTLTI